MAENKSVLQQALDAFRGRKYKSVVSLTAKLGSDAADQSARCVDLGMPVRRITSNARTTRRTLLRSMD